MVHTGSTCSLEFPKLLDNKVSSNSLSSAQTSNPVNNQVNRTEKSSKKRHLNVATWNVRRGLIKRENEITILLESEELDVLFLTETDLKRSNAQNYKISGFNTLIQAGEHDTDVVRIIALTRENCGVEIILRDDLMSTTFPSVWIEVQDKFKSKTVIGGFYRQWSSNGKLTVPEQVTQIEGFCNQISTAATPNGKMVILGDVNLCSEKWLSEDYDRKSVSQPLLRCLEQNGLQVQDVGLTYQADHVLPDGSVPSSALDHVYSSLVIKDSIKISKIQNSATDHLPVLVHYNLDLTKARFQHTITKRSFKNFSKEVWNASLARQDWSDVENCEDVNEMVSVFDENVLKALDQAAPIKNIQYKIKS